VHLHVNFAVKPLTGAIKAAVPARTAPDATASSGGNEFATDTIIARRP
jgi:hypothetical protein